MITNEAAALDCLKLRVNKKDILLLLEQIQIVLPVAELDPVPNNDPAFAGLLGFHSDCIPVYHLSCLIDEPTPSYNLNTPILLCKIKEQVLGLLVSDVINVGIIDSNKINSVSSFQSVPYVLGTWEEGNHSIWIMDLEKLMAFHKQRLEKKNEHFI